MKIALVFTMALVSFALCTSSLSSSAFAEEAEAVSSSASADVLSTVRYDRIDPCTSWSYNSDVRGYVCSFRSISSYIPERYSLDSALDNLQRQINDLENRVKELESRLAP